MTSRYEGMLARPGLNVAIAGTGGIGSALTDALLALEQVDRLVVLGRSEPECMNDERLRHIRLDAADSESIAQAGTFVASHCERLHLVVNTVGILHDSEVAPEKRIRDIDLPAMQKVFAINAMVLPLLASALSPLLRHDEPAVLASLSARVGSIADNRMGGWYSYRASKAAHNMFLRTLALEWRISHRNATLLALHPGTVATRLSKPYTPRNYRNRVLTPGECAEALLSVIDRQTPEKTGSFLDWQGESIPW